MWRQLGVAVLYGGVSVAVNFINKYAVIVFPLPAALMTAKMLTTLILVALGAKGGMFQLPPPSWERALVHAPITFVSVGHGLLSLWSLCSLNVPVYSTLKRTSPVMVLAAKAVMNRRLPDAPTAISVLMLVGGCILTGAGDLDFNPAGYALALVCAALQAAYTLLAERRKHVVAATDKQQQAVQTDDYEKMRRSATTAVEVLFYIGAIGSPVVAAVFTLSGEAVSRPGLGHALQQLRRHMPDNRSLAAWLLLTASAETALTGCMVLCATSTSALTTTVVGALKNVATVALGCVLLGGVKATWVLAVGISLNIVGGVWYSALKAPA
ncbi:hypothetical protein GPECTOR_344g90 [Gonium pectorale]|uniref:Sugar phosphate transporter domain-containing protein n=1 Tax=Gonium pectorale TaxID=33097 RepID=A0A150FVK2_GONPE|nr:hypothetical protein GPECTOR_344g90 [Gonium pectorale]|eukprot:KXZ41644.1 hypothetical protein GPECTOR_344g90 [Gonium pectorale]